jgi:hypothetical protein
MSDIYRVTARSTNCVQPRGDTCWVVRLLYCGTDREDARVAFHSSALEDASYGPGQRARETTCEVIKDGGSDNFAEDITEVCET